ncbi:unnamed protein product [Ixodes pacificus]
MPPSEGTGKPSVHPDPAHPEPVPPGPDQPGPSQPEPDQPEPAQPEPATPGPVDPEPVNPEPVNPEPVHPQPVDPEPVSPGPVAPKPGSRDEGEENCPCSVDTDTDVCGVRRENAESRQGATRMGKHFFDDKEAYYVDPRRIFRPRPRLPFHFGRPAPGGLFHGQPTPGGLFRGRHMTRTGLTGRLATQRRQPQQDPPAWPWMVAIVDQANPARRCAGVLLDSQHVLTAAQCFGPDRGARSVAELNVPGEPSVHRVVTAVTHPDYRSPDGYSDVAVVRLVPPLPPSSLSPICLPRVINERRVPHGSLLDAVSWSNRQRDFHPGSMTEKRFRVIPVTVCNKTFAGVDLSPYPLGISDEDFLCAEVEKTDREECVGLPGSPLMAKQRGLWTIVGIYSFGVSCGGSAHYPTVFTRVAPYVTWINEVLGVRR